MLPLAITSARRSWRLPSGSTQSQKGCGRVLGHLDISEVAHDPELAGPGFINIRLKSEAVSRLFFKPLYPDRLLPNL